MLKAILERSSYRGRYEPNPVPREHLKLIMDAGLAAPSGCNMQTTSLVCVDDPTLIHTLGGILNKSHFASAPAAICVLSQPIASYHGAFFDVQDYAAAIQNILIAVQALGYASCWVEGYITHGTNIDKQMAEALHVPEDYRVVAYLPIGIPTDDVSKPKKKPFSERAWFNGFMKP